MSTEILENQKNQILNLYFHSSQGLTNAQDIYKKLTRLGKIPLDIGIFLLLLAIANR